MMSAERPDVRELDLGEVPGSGALRGRRQDGDRGGDAELQVPVPHRLTHHDGSHPAKFTSQ
jgi:hypothetical protein